MLKIALIGDYDPEKAAHIAIPKALEAAAQTFGAEVQHHWLPTAEISTATSQLGAFDGIWCVPGSPYVSMAGALCAIRFAREKERPFLGTCGGFQHALIEYARNVLGLAADHAESDPQADTLLISPLACSLVEKTGQIQLLDGTRIRAICGQSKITEKFHCSYGFNPRYREHIFGGNLRLTGIDAAGDARVIELHGHPFFIATLFQPERAGLKNLAHPLIVAFLKELHQSRAR